MSPRALRAAPLVLALLAACDGDTPQLPPVTCGATADGGPLTVNDPAGYTCGTATSPTINVYTFTAAGSTRHTVTLATTRADADLCVKQQGALVYIGCSVFVPPTSDVVSFTATPGTTYEVEVDDASFTPPSSYGVRVTSP